MSHAHLTPRDVPYFRLRVDKAFGALSKKERAYAHHMNMAAWHGAIAGSAQVSHESPAILKFLFTLFASNSVAALRAASKTNGVSDDDYDQFVEYSALFYSNMGNYHSFGDSKFVPRCPPDVVEAIVKSAPNNPSAALLAMFNEVSGPMFSATDGELRLDFEPNGHTSYYSPGITKAEVELVDTFLKIQRIEQWNTRVWKVSDKHFEVRIPCTDERRVPHTTDDGVQIDFVYGDHATNFRRVVAELAEARKHAANKEQEDMIDAYINHFTTGDINDHKDSQRHWVKDKGPVVETNMGFIETYRDPLGVRAEWEAFVAIVDKLQSQRFGELASRGPEFISQLPWGAEFERDRFVHPDFTLLEVLSFVCASIYSGICIPNYDDVRQEGFKNVMLGNILNAINLDQKIGHITEPDWQLYKRHVFTAVSISIGIHELLGHGTGKLLTESEDGTFNFDKGTLVNPLTGKVVDTWYPPGETWSTVFGGLANAYEECRAEAVALYLSLNTDILHIFGVDVGHEAAEMVHVVWLNMVRNGLIGLEHYTPEATKWRQAHMRARFCILQVLLRCPNPVVKIDHKPDEDKLDITIDAARIATDGKAAIGELLRHLNINKATADFEAGKKYFEDLTAVNDEWLGIRDTVMRMRKPRREFVQAHTRIAADGDVELVEFDASPAGVVETMVARHRDIPL